MHEICTLILLYSPMQKCKVLLYSLPSVEPGADPGVQTVSSQVIFLSHPSAVGCHYFLTGLRHRPSTDTKLYCLETEAHKCEKLAQGCYGALYRWELNRVLATAPAIVRYIDS